MVRKLVISGMHHKWVQILAVGELTLPGDWIVLGFLSKITLCSLPTAVQKKTKKQ